MVDESERICKKSMVPRPSYYHRNLPRGTGVSHERRGQDSRCTGRDSNSHLPYTWLEHHRCASSTSSTMEYAKTTNTGFGKLVYSEGNHASPPLLILVYILRLVNRNLKSTPRPTYRSTSLRAYINLLFYKVQILELLQETHVAVDKESVLRHKH
jgi:hypothetical protein